MLAEPQRAAKEKAGRPPPRQRRGLAAYARTVLVSLIAAELMIVSGPAAASMAVDARRSMRAAENSPLGIFTNSAAFSAGETLSNSATRIEKEGPLRTKIASESREWQSPDPILASYMHGRSSGGAFAPQNLGLYSYAWNSPIRLRDPDGRQVAGTAGMQEFMNTYLNEAPLRQADRAIANADRLIAKWQEEMVDMRAGRAGAPAWAAGDAAFSQTTLRNFHGDDLDTAYMIYTNVVLASAGGPGEGPGLLAPGGGPTRGAGPKLLALGRNRSDSGEALLKPFAEGIGAKRVLDLHAPAGMSLPEEIAFRMREADQIHFNMAEMGDPQLVLTEGRAFYPGSSVRYTSWEFSQAIDIPANRAKTFLHFPGGSIVPALKAPY